MDPISAIAGSSSAMTLASVQMAVAAKILKLSQTAAAEPVARLIEAAAQNVQDSIEAMVGELGGSVDAYA